MDSRNRAATKDALERIEANGADLSKPMLIDFFVAVPDQASGEAVAQEALALGFATSVEQDETTGDWTCYCSLTMTPTLGEVLRIEETLDAIGRLHGGYADGFGSFGNAPKPS